MFKFNPVALGLFLAIGGLGSEPAVGAVAQQDFVIQSERMEGAREIVVHTPNDYSSSDPEGYPVIYMLDAGTKDKMTAELANYYHWAEVMPKVIVVGLRNVNRGRDFLPGYYSFEREGERHLGDGGKLLSYIKNELIPFVDKRFNTGARKVLVGHSWAGQFTTYALSQSPGLFDAYFITSPAFGAAGEWGQKTFDALEQVLSEDPKLPDFVYLSVGGEEGAASLASYHRLAGLLRQHLAEDVRLYHETHSAAVHNSNSAISIPKALQLYFTNAP